MAELDHKQTNSHAITIVSMITLIFTITISTLVLSTNDFDPTAFAHIGTRFSEGDPNGTVGYDGQFSYFIARDGAGAIPFLDGPTLRYQRIIYPLTGRVFSFGQDNWVGWSLLVVNILAHSAGTVALAFLLHKAGRSPFWALMYAFWIGNLFALRFMLNEPLCFAFALGAIIAYQKKQYRWTIVLLILSTLTKEIGAVIAGGLAFHAALGRGQWQWAGMIFGAPVLAFLTWWGVMRMWLGTLPTIYPSAKIHFIPFEGLFFVFEDTPEIGFVGQFIKFMMLALFLGLPALILTLLALYRMWKTREVTLASALMLAGGTFVMVMPDVSWVDLVAAYRVGVPAILTGILFVGTHYPNRLRVLAFSIMPASLILLLLPQLWLGG